MQQTSSLFATFCKGTALAAVLGFTLTACSTSSPTSPMKKKVFAAQTVQVNAVSSTGVGQEIGYLTLQDSAQGLVIKSNLKSLPAGPHGFHIHEKDSCEPAEKDGKMGAAIAAGGHYNPQQVAHHGSPTAGHLGDLPVLMVDANGQANTTVIAPRLKLADVQGRAIMVHAGGDNYSDDPKPLGGGGDRIACGLIR